MVLVVNGVGGWGFLWACVGVGVVHGSTPQEFHGFYSNKTRLQSDSLFKQANVQTLFILFISIQLPC